MAELQTIFDIRLVLKPKEFNLISKALGGRLKPEEIDEATELGNELCKMRAKVGQHYAHENDKLVQSLKEAGVWETEENS